VGLTGVFAQNVKALDKKNGFRDVAFGADIATLTGFVGHDSPGDTKLYSRPTDELRVGTATLSSIRYIFYKGQLCNVVLETKGLPNSRAMLASLRDLYGPGKQFTRHVAQRFDWQGKAVQMSYQENLLSGDAVVSMSSQPFTQQQSADEAATRKAKTGR
jgi:hypothetical protein